MTTQEKKLIARIIDILDVLRKADDCEFTKAFDRLKSVKTINYDLWMALACMLNSDRDAMEEYLEQAEESANYMREPE